MKNSEMLEKLCAEYGVSFTRDDRRHGVLLADTNGNIFNLTKLLNTTFFDDYYKLPPYKAVHMDKNTPIVYNYTELSMNNKYSHYALENIKELCAA